MISTQDRMLRLINVFLLLCVFATYCWGQDAINANELIIYPRVEEVSARDSLLQTIGAAKKTIDMAVYVLQDPQTANALKKKAQQGITIRLMVENDHYLHAFNKGTQDQSSVLKELQSVGIDIHSGPSFLKNGEQKGHLHARYIIIDGETIVLTSGNFDESTFDHCRDFAIIVNKTPELETQFSFIQSVFQADWDDKPLTGQSEPSSIILGPEGQRKRFEQFLNTAQKSVKMYQQYCNDPEMTKLLLSLKQKGVEIQLLMMAYPTGYSNDPNQETQDQLSEAGIDIRLVNVDNKTYMHARAIIIDDKALIGTTSLSALSLDLNRDLNFVIKGKTVDTLVQQFNKDWEQAFSIVKGRQVAKEKEIDWKKLFFQK